MEVVGIAEIQTFNETTFSCSSDLISVEHNGKCLVCLRNSNFDILILHSNER